MRLRKFNCVFLLSIFFTLPVLGGCAFQQADDYSLPVVEYEETVEVTEFENFTGRWWQDFSDSGLTGQVETALSNNFSLKATYDRLRAAREQLSAQNAEYYPTLDAEIGARRGENERGEVESSYNYQLTAGYEVDLWGRIEASSEAALYEYRASREELKTAAITLSARVAASWSRLINQKKIIDLEEKILATQENRLELLQKRFRNGQVNLSEINRAKKELKSARNSIYTARTKYEALKNELAVLTGQDPRESIKTGGEELPRPDQLPEAGLSADLVRRRPDVRKTFYNIQARDRQLAASISKQYPRLNLKFTGSGSSVDAADLFEQWAGAFSVKLVASLLDGGEDRAEVRRSEAQRDETVHKYGQTVLEAFREVEDAVNQEKSTRRQLENIEDNLELVRGNYQQASLRYQNGSARYSMVLAEQLNHYRAKRDYLTKRRELFEDRVELYRVLSGGWEM